MEEGGVKTEPALSAEAFMLASRAVTVPLQEQNELEENEKNAEALAGSDLVEHSNTNTPIQAHGDASSSSRERSGSDDDLLDGVELLLEEKLEIAEFVKSNPETARVLVRENFSAKFGKPIDLDDIDNIVGMEPHDLTRDEMAASPKSQSRFSFPKGGPRTPEIEKYVLGLFEEAESREESLSGSTVRTKALQHAKQIGHRSFSATKGWLLRFLARHDKKVSQSSADKDSKPEVRTRNQFSLCEKHEVAKYLVQNPNMLAKDIALLFSEKFKKPLTADTVRRIKSEGDKLLDEALANDNRYKNKSKSSNFPEIEQVMLAVMDEAEKQKMTLTSGYIRNMALELAKQLGIENFNASQGWLQRFQMRHGKKLDDGRKLRQNRPKPSPFVRLTFGEKHEIANFMKENPGMQLKQYAEMFTKKWNRNVTERQIMGTKENIDKWSLEQYKGSNQSYEKITRKPRTCLSKTEREEIATFISQNSGMTLEETARIFSEKWSKDINRTHIASAKRMIQNLQNMINNDITNVLGQSSNDHHNDLPTMTGHLSTNNGLSSNDKMNNNLDQFPLLSGLRNDIKTESAIDSLSSAQKSDILGNSHLPSHATGGLDLYSHFMSNPQKDPHDVTSNLFQKSSFNEAASGSLSFSNSLNQRISSSSVVNSDFNNLTSSSLGASSNPLDLIKLPSSSAPAPNPFIQNQLFGQHQLNQEPSFGGLHNQAGSGALGQQVPGQFITCPQCYRQFDSGPVFWCHFSMEHSNLLSPFNSLNPLNQLGSATSQATPLTTQGMPLGSSLNPQINPLGLQGSDNSLLAGMGGHLPGQLSEPQGSDPNPNHNQTQNYLNSGFGLPQHI